MFEKREDPITGTKFSVKRGTGRSLTMKAEGGDATGDGEFKAKRFFNADSLAFQAQEQGAMKRQPMIIEFFKPSPVKRGRKKKGEK